VNAGLEDLAHLGAAAGGAPLECTKVMNRSFGPRAHYCH
jgi:hypothetical protein